MKACLKQLFVRSPKGNLSLIALGKDGTVYKFDKESNTWRPYSMEIGEELKPAPKEKSPMSETDLKSILFLVKDDDDNIK